ncbi:MAG: DUF4139 domain-containing protein [Candidatus Sericytochromatia bacterium]
MRYHVSLLLAAMALGACQTAPAGPPQARAVLAPDRPLYRLAASEAAPAAAPIVAIGPEARTDLAVTVYNEDLGLVADTREAPLVSGKQVLRFEGVPERVEATSLSLTAPGGKAPAVLEQIFAFDVLTPQKLLEAYVGKAVRFRLASEGDRPSQIVDAVLLSAKDGLILEIDGEVRIAPPGEVIVPAVPAGTRTSPTVEWLLEVAEPGARQLTGTYQTRGMSWQADYTLVLEEGSDRAGLSGWAAVTNRSGADFPEAKLTLVAGDLSRVPKAPVPMPAAGGPERVAVSDQFVEQPLAEFHSYHLDREAALPDEQTKQIKLFEAGNVQVERRYVFDAQRMIIQPQDDKPDPVEVTVRFANTEANGLGLPLPKGVVHLVTPDRTVIGEDAIAHTPTGETVEVRMGKAFDVLGERRQTKFDQIGERVREESWKVELRNQKATAVTVEVVEHPYGEWKVLASSVPHRAESANRIVFPVTVPAKGESELTYTIRYGE